MNFDNPVVQVVALLAIGYFWKLWWTDYRRDRVSNPDPQALPGATRAAWPIIAIAVVGAFAILGAEVVGEYALGISGEQSDITALFGLYTLTAAFAEELIFRGFLVVQSRGRRTLWLSILFFSALFALAHPFLWKWNGWENGGLSLELTTKAIFSTAVVFVASLWFYWMRFNILNPLRSLVPCILAHLAKNAGVVIIKFLQGHVSGWW